MFKANFLGRWLSFVLLSFALNVSAQIPAGYYANAEGKSGEKLKSALNDIISGHTEYPYTSSSTDTWDILKVADRDPNNANNVIGIYSGFSMDADAEYASGQGWSREHVWAKSRGDFGTSPGPGTDCHHLRAEDLSTNSARSNRNFDECTTPYVDQAGTYNGATESFTSANLNVWKPRAEVKGDVARMLFYMATRYEGENGEVDLELSDTLLTSDSKAPLQARLSTLLVWNQDDPVSDAERDRNDIIYGYQNNRNPFIDHPEYVERIWGANVVEPSLQVNAALANFGAVNYGQASSVQSYTVSAENLTDDVSITSSDGFQISLTDQNQDFTTSILLSPIAGSVASTAVFVRFVPLADNNASVSSNIIHSSTGANTQSIMVEGSEYFKVVPEINFNYAQRTIDPEETYEVQLYADQAPNEDIDVQMKLIEQSGFTYDQNFTTTPALSNDEMTMVWESGELNSSFMVHFSPSLIGRTANEALVFSIVALNDYVIGTNGTFELKIKQTDVINGLSDKESALTVYPNPTAKKIKISWSNATFSYTITDLLGHVVIQGATTNSVEIEVAALPQGQYILKATNKEESLTSLIQIK